MAKESPLERAKKAMSGKTTASRVAAAENYSPKPGVKPQPETKAGPAYAPAAKYVEDRKAQIEAARRADERAIAARRKAKGMKKGGKVRGAGCCKQGIRKAKMY